MANVDKAQSAVKKNVKALAGKYLTFDLGREEYCIGILKVREIIGLMEITAVPHTPRYIKGVINLRGEIIPVVRMESLLGAVPDGGGGPNRKRRMIIIDVAAGRFGFFVDEVLEVARIQSGDMQPAPALGAAGPLGAAVTGIVKVSGRMIVCLDPEKIIRDDIMAKEPALGG